MLSKRIKISAINRVTMAKIEKANIHSDEVPQFHLCPFSSRDPHRIRISGIYAFCKNRCGEIFPTLEVIVECPCNSIGPTLAANKFWEAMDW